MTAAQRAENALYELGIALGDLVEEGERVCPPDRRRLIESHSSKMLPTLERLGAQLALLVRHIDLCRPRASGNVRSLFPRRR